MDSVYGIVREICIFIIITTIVDNLLQGSEYRKYVRLVSGIMVTLILIKPVLNFIRLGDTYSGFVGKYINKLNTGEYEREIKMYGDAEDMPLYYADMLEQSLKTYLETEGYELISCNWKVNDNTDDKMYGNIEGLKVTVKSGNGHTIDEVHIDDNGHIELYNRRLEEKIAGYYGISADDIEVITE